MSVCLSHVSSTGPWGVSPKSLHAKKFSLTSRRSVGNRVDSSDGQSSGAPEKTAMKTSSGGSKIWDESLDRHLPLSVCVCACFIHEIRAPKENSQNMGLGLPGPSYIKIELLKKQHPGPGFQLNPHSPLLFTRTLQLPPAHPRCRPLSHRPSIGARGSSLWRRAAQLASNDASGLAEALVASVETWG